MSYATVSDVTDLFRNLDITKTDTAVDSAKIQKWLDSASLSMNARLGQIYDLTIPIDNILYPEAYTILAQIEAFYVADIVDDVLYKYTTDEKKPQWGKRAEAIFGTYAPIDCSKCAPTSILPGVPYLGVSSQRGGFKASRTSTAAIFKKGANNW